MKFYLNETHTWDRWYGEQTPSMAWWWCLILWQCQSPSMFMHTQTLGDSVDIPVWNSCEAQIICHSALMQNTGVLYTRLKSSHCCLYESI